MPDRLIIPRHLRILAEVWAELAERLAHGITAALPQRADHLERGDAARFAELAGEETSAMTSWVSRTTAWCNGPLTAALGNSDIADHDMQYVAKRLSYFADELSERRDVLRTLANDPAMRAAAPRLDALYVSLLEQTRDFTSAVVDALGPAALSHANAMRQGDNIELSFTFRPSVDRPMAEFLAWMQRTQSTFDALESCHYEDPTDASHPNVDTWLHVGVVLIILTILGLGYYTFGAGIVLILLAVMLLIFIIRHPILALLALLLGMN